jgi:hypothetical protein
VNALVRSRPLEDVGVLGDTDLGAVTAARVDALAGLVDDDGAVVLLARDDDTVAVQVVLAETSEVSRLQIPPSSPAQTRERVLVFTNAACSVPIPVAVGLEGLAAVIADVRPGPAASSDRVRRATSVPTYKVLLSLGRGRARLAEGSGRSRCAPRSVVLKMPPCVPA